MRVQMPRLKIRSKERCQIIKITGELKEKVRETETKNGFALLFSPHTTTALYINDGTDELSADLVDMLAMLFPRHKEKGLSWKHDEITDPTSAIRNTDSHFKSIVVGGQLVLPLVDGEILLGPWQDVMFAELDGPLERDLYVFMYGE